MSSDRPPPGAPAIGADAWVRHWHDAVRVRQWPKNLLVFVPLLAAHRFQESALLGAAALTFVWFTVVSSAVYLLNDVVDRPDDRAHHRKRDRAIATGRIPATQALIAAAVLASVGFAGAAWTLPAPAVLTLGVYVALNLGYTTLLKRVPLVDVLVLSAMYTLRIVAGAWALGLPLTAWMLGFSAFTFVSLALAKRSAELVALARTSRDTSLRGRGYSLDDLPYLRAVGVAVGLASGLLLALYVRDPTASALYGRPEILWLAVLAWLYWIGRVWLLTLRGEMDEDPVAFATRDGVSYLVGVALVALAMLAR